MNSQLITKMLDSQTHPEEWRTSVTQYFEEAAETPEDLSEGLAAALTYMANRTENAELLAENYSWEFLVGTVNGIAVARKAMVSFQPADAEELEGYFLCLEDFPHEELLSMESVVIAKFDEAQKSRRSSIVLSGAITVAKLRTTKAVEILTDFIVTCPDELLVRNLLDRFLQIGPASEEALFQKFVATIASEQTRQAIQTVAREDDSTFSTDISVNCMNSLLSLPSDTAVQCIDLVYCFQERKHELVESLQRLHKKVLGSDMTEWPVLVQRALDHATAE